jgi:hypothetical protein
MEVADLLEVPGLAGSLRQHLQAAGTNGFVDRRRPARAREIAATRGRKIRSLAERVSYISV